VAYANWGPTDLGRLGNATFPAGAELYFQTSTPTANALAYDVTSPVTTYGVDAGAGGDARNNSTLACHAAFTGAITPFNVGTLEQLAAIHRGTPCTENPQSDANGSSLNPNVWWSPTSVSLGTITDGLARPAGTGTFYTANAHLRVAFSSGNAVTYLRCYTRTSSGSPRNCTAIGSGTYAIQTLGDGRAMTFSNLPAIAQQLSFTRVFVERGGTVYFGYRNADNVAKATLRLNLSAANALLGTLGIAAIAP
jgi:trimeric autotransporter adhesin